MARKSTKENKNIYQRAREALDLTREEASELLITMSPERIELKVKRYEYNEMAIGDRGMLTHQGTRYQGFERT